MTTQEEKINYIYERLKKQEKQEKIARIVKWVFRAVIVWYIYFFMAVLLPKLAWGLVPGMDILPFNFWEKEESREINLSEENIEELKWTLENYFNESY